MVHPQHQSMGQVMPAVSFNGKVIERTNKSQIPRDPRRQNADVQNAGRINKTQEQERTVCAESHGFKGIEQTPSVPIISGFDTQHYLL